jgi:hypothetical protein
MFLLLPLRKEAEHGPANESSKKIDHIKLLRMIHIIKTSEFTCGASKNLVLYFEK